ncbi:hypothetical protein T552_01678 [Pneumocystis carinii B80]|uniref:Uncharacterized protein n=1 Tax=Pneumocystis carinii (strain B80) TaxID=1408658 RepID=A0A0W4ZJ76_PNEC8|nr:hypothetical protein T552_01678 [Pneumocystis carinii B80]KTW28416.1 hypothetical protein T552_01678 [Pneumocystis carinii B80]
MIFKKFKEPFGRVKIHRIMFISPLYIGDVKVMGDLGSIFLNSMNKKRYIYNLNDIRYNKFGNIKGKLFHFISNNELNMMCRNRYLYNDFNKREYHEFKQEKVDKKIMVYKENIRDRILNMRTIFSQTKSVMRFLKGEKRMLSIAIVFIIIGSSVSMSMPYIIGRIMDYMVKPSINAFFGIEPVFFYSGLAFIFLIGGACNFGRLFLMRIICERVISKLRSRLYQNTLKHDLGFFDVNASGDLISRLSSDTAVVAKSLTQNISDGLKYLISTIVGLGMMTCISAQLTSVMMLIIPPIVFGSIFYGQYIKVLSKKIQKALGDLIKISEDLGNIHIIKAFTGEIIELRRYNNKIREIFQLVKKDAFLNSTFLGLIGFSGNLTVLITLAYGSHMVNKSIITIGDLSSFLLYTAYTGNSMVGLSGFYSEFMKGLGASSRLFELIDKKITRKPTAGIFVDSIKGSIKFQDVCFSYPTRPDMPIFSKLSFTIEQGKNVAICGPSGTGKSTIAYLLLRFYDLNSGKITVNDIDIQKINLKQLRKKIGIVPQNPALFPGTIKENIAYGNPDATLEEIIEAIEKSNSTFIMNFPKNIDTYIGGNGIQLSGGQKQRIAIARVLVRKPEILILDEATSALDGKSEVLVDQALQDLIQRENLTTITIAHRLGTIKRAHKIIVLDHNGKLVEEGSYIELNKNVDSAFMQLMKSQIQGYSSIKNGKI